MQAEHVMALSAACNTLFQMQQAKYTCYTWLSKAQVKQPNLVPLMLPTSTQHDVVASYIQMSVFRSRMQFVQCLFCTEIQLSELTLEMSSTRCSYFTYIQKLYSNALDPSLVLSWGQRWHKNVRPLAELIAFHPPAKQARPGFVIKEAFASSALSDSKGERSL